MKKVLIILLTLFFIHTINFAYDLHQDAQKKSADVMVKLGLLKGYKDGDLKLYQKITRAEFATIIARMMGSEVKPSIPNVSFEMKFKDVPKKHWAYHTIKMVVNSGYMKGYPNNTFGPSKNITYAEAIATMVRLLGYHNGITGKWPNNYINKAKQLGITKNLYISPQKPITRGDISILIVNSLPIEINQKEKQN